MKVADIRFVPAPAELRATGLRGWAGCEIDGQLRLESLAIRRTRDGRYCIAFPMRRDGAGVERPYVFPVDDAAREAIEGAVLGELRARGFVS